MLSLVRAGVPTPKPEFPPPTASPDDVLLFFQRYMLHYYNQQTPITPIDQFEPIHGDELYLRSLEKSIDCVGDNIVGKAIYTDLHWRSKYAACFHVWPYYQLLLILSALCIQFSDAVKNSGAAWFCWFLALIVCFLAYSIGADPPTRLPELLVFRPWCALCIQQIFKIREAFRQ
ncbi:hypothetical protein I7I48_02836 [Histoplasma ohiense]|nr:hypothetical protein I7I48_02836 [Histoplasma ohiense (nom. inval.)]